MLPSAKPLRVDAIRIMWVGFLLRLGIALWNGFWGPSFGADGDALGLHQMAVDFTHGVFPVVFRVNYLYPYLLGAFYRGTVTSLFLGSVLSCVAWFASAQVLLTSMRLLEITRASRAKAMLIYAVLPSAVLWTSVTLREPYQLLAVNLAMFAALKIGLHGAWRYWGLLLVAIAAGGILHGSLLGWGGWVMFATALWWVSRRPHLITWGRVVLAAAALVVLAVLSYRLFTTLYSYPVERGLAFAVESYQRGGLSIGVRTDYRSGTVQIADNLDLLRFIPVALLQYLFEPVPWRVTSFADLETLVENLLRAGLVAQAVARLVTLRRRARPAVLVVLTSYLVLETAWGVGTFNWGTAARHHIPSMGMLLLAAFVSPRLPMAAASTPHSSPLLVTRAV